MYNYYQYVPEKCVPIKRGPPGPTGPTGPAGGGGGGIAADPQNTLFVSPSWTEVVNPATHFTTIAAAINQAGLLSGTVEIVIYPASYSETLTLTQSNVNFIGLDASLTTISSMTINVSGENSFTNLTLQTVVVQSSGYVSFLRCNLTTNFSTSTPSTPDLYFDWCSFSNIQNFNQASVLLYNCQSDSTTQFVSGNSIECNSCIINASSLDVSGLSGITFNNTYVSTASGSFLSSLQITNSQYYSTGPITSLQNDLAITIENSIVEVNGLTGSGSIGQLATNLSTINLGTSVINSVVDAWNANNCVMTIPSISSIGGQKGSNLNFSECTVNITQSTGSEFCLLCSTFIGNQNTWNIIVNTSCTVFEAVSWIDTNSSYEFEGNSNDICFLNTGVVDGYIILDGSTIDITGLTLTQPSQQLLTLQNDIYNSVKNTTWNMNFNISNPLIPLNNVTINMSDSIWNMYPDSSSASIFNILNNSTVIMNNSIFNILNYTGTEPIFSIGGTIINMSNSYMTMPDGSVSIFSCNAQTTLIMNNCIFESLNNTSPLLMVSSASYTTTINFLNSYYLSSSTNVFSGNPNTGGSLANTIIDQNLVGTSTIVTPSSIAVAFQARQNDTSYYINATSSSTGIQDSVYISNKTVSGFTINTPTSGPTGPIDWTVYRPYSSIV